MFAQWTAPTGDEVCRRLETDPHTGLAEEEAKRRRRKYGENILVAPPRLSLPILFLNQFKDFMVLVLLGATLLSGLLGEYSDALTILVIVVINALLGLIQEYRAERSLEALKKMAAPRARVLRGGAIKSIPAREVVPGDLVVLEAGDRVCADIRLLSVQNLSVNEAPLTGESEAVLKSAAPLPGSVAGTPGDALNMVFSGTDVVAGRGYGVVTATAMETELGRIAHLMEEVGQPVTPLQERLERLGKILVAACLAVCIGVTVLGVVRGEPLYAMFMAGISLAVAAIPEGLPAIVTVSLALGVQRMIRRRAIVRRLPAVETLGSASVICSDKTGTLTMNRMSVRQLYSDGVLFRRQGSGAHGWEQGGEEANPGKNAALRLTLSIAALCNNAYPVNNGYQGDPTEVALLEAARAAGLPLRRRKEGREKEFPFSSERKMMSVIHREKGRRRLLLKGAPEMVLERCRGVWSGGHILALTPGRRRELQEQVERMAALGLRALGTAFRELSGGPLPAEPGEVEKDLVWVGLIGLEDPPRPEVLPAIRLCHRAGIRVIMITGDHRATAVAVARRLEILRPGGLVLTGAELSAMDDGRLQRLMGRVQVFARVSPTHKLRIVRALKKQGEVVAMTGDGVNDAPAIKEADIGIAMGITGTEVTRGAAALVLADDNFRTIVAAVEEGRNIYSNIRKFIRFLLGCNTGEVLTMVIAILAGLPLPLKPIQILWINLVTDGFPALALGVDGPEKALMERPPRRREEGVFSGGLWGKLMARGVMIAAVTVAVFYLMLASGADLERARTAAFATLIFTQLAYVFDCRSEDRPFWRDGRPPNFFLLAAVASSGLLTLLVIYRPFFRGVFYTQPLTAAEWAVICAAGVLPTLLGSGLFLLREALARIGGKKGF